jgi:diguanylate cyclase (GGDEF)-like protein/PAS domain S-box-containing protein
MDIRQKMAIIVIASILLTAIPASILVYKYAQSKILSSELATLIEITQRQADIASQRFLQGQPKLEGLSRLLQAELVKPIKRGEIDGFYQAMSRYPDGVWRNRKPSFNGSIEAGIFLPLNTKENAKELDTQKIRHWRIKKIMDIFGSAASNRMENVWYLSPQRSEIIFDTTFPDFVFDQKADNDYTATPWVTYTSPQLNPGRKFGFTPPLFDPVPKVWMVSAIYPLYLGDNWIGSVGEDMQISNVLEFLFKKEQFYAGTQNFLLDNQGDFILAGDWQSKLEAHQDASQFDLGDEPELTTILQTHLQNSPKILASVVVANKQYVAIGMTLQPVNWRYYKLVPVSEILSSMRELFISLVFVICLISVISGLLISLVVHYFVVRRIKLLAEGMRLYEAGENRHVSQLFPGNDEISLTAKEFDVMIDRIDKNIEDLEITRDTLRLSEERWKFAVEGTGDGMWDWDITTGEVLLSERWKAMLGYGDSEFPNHVSAWSAQIHPEDKPFVLSSLDDYLTNVSTNYAVEYRMHHKNDEWIWILGRGIIVRRDAEGKPLRMVGSHSDITERKRSEAKIQLAASVFTSAREGILITDTDGCIIEVNDTFSHIMGYSRKEVLGKNPRIFQSARQSDEFYNGMWQALLEKNYWTGEIWNRRKNGEVYAAILTISGVQNTVGKTEQYVALYTDITTMKEHQRQLEHLAHYDALTNLPNRVLLADRLQQAIIQTERRKSSLAVIYLDLDGFKAVNDTHGHEMGDELLIIVSQRMQEVLRESDTLARIGGDEFVAVLVDLEQTADCKPVLRRLLAVSSASLIVNNVELQLSASIGVTFYPQDNTDADQLMRHADQAMYVAKQTGKNRYHLFDVEHDSAIKTQHESLEYISGAHQKNEFVLYYQPKVNMLTGEIIGTEALIRWQHPEDGLLPPSAFLPIIENQDISLQIGEWVIDSALTQLGIWHTAGINLSISVNISANQLQQNNFVSTLLALLNKHPEVNPGKLELEILETSALENFVDVSNVIRTCHQMGVHFALDDFGTGYSSLTYLKRLPVSILKIDQTFVRDMLDDPDDLTIVKSVIGLAKSFQRQVIAEGVETVAHGAMLLSIGCELAQGYGISRPMPAEDIPGWMDNWNKNTDSDFFRNAVHQPND